MADCNKLEAKVAPAGEPILECSESARAVGIGTGVVAVVEAEDITFGGGLPRNRFQREVLGVSGDGLHALDEPIRGLDAPIAGEQGPHHHGHALPLNDFA